MDFTLSHRVLLPGEPVPESTGRINTTHREAAPLAEHGMGTRDGPARRSEALRFPTSPRGPGWIATPDRERR